MLLLRFIARRIPYVIPQLFGITLVSFFMVKLIPGDPAVMMLGSRLAAGLNGTKGSEIQGLGEESYMDSTATVLVVRKGNRAVMLTMHLLPHSRRNGPIIARQILDRL